jgi:GH24 family phage-related lysozyme (muramidase)
MDRPRLGRAAAVLARTARAGRYEHSTLRTYVDQQLWTAVKLAILQWDIGGGKVEPGLLRRRKAEAEAELISVPPVTAQRWGATRAPDDISSPW